jgi:hypothetical protein
LAYSQIVAAEVTIHRSRGASYMTVATSRRSTTFRRSPAGGVAAAALAAAAILLPTASPAAAAPDDGFWYFDALNVQAAHDAGWTGEGVTIAVMDSPINMDVPTLANADVEVEEPSYCQAEDGSGFMPAQSTELSGQASALHGTNVLSLISGTGDGYTGQAGVKGVAPGAKVLYFSIMGASDQGGSFVACLDENGDEITDIALADAMNKAMDAGAKIISVSSLQTAGPELYAAQIRAVREGVIVVGGLPNAIDPTYSGEWPATANGSVAVQAADSNAAIATTSGIPNSNKSTTVIAPGVDVVSQGDDSAWENQGVASGTSLATPIVAGFLALAAQRCPDATGNQLIQSLIRTTGGEIHDPAYDTSNQVGYGFVSATGMLAADPSGFADTNPMVTDGPGDIPTVAEIAAGAAAPGSGLDVEPSSEPSAGPQRAASPAPVALVVGLVVGSLVGLGILVLIVILVVRRAKRNSPIKERLES